MTDVTHLEESLKHLLAQVRALDVADPQAKRRVELLVLDIESVLEQPKPGAARATLGDRWRRSIVGFELSHPRLSGMMNDVIEELSKMGI